MSRFAFNPEINSAPTPTGAEAPATTAIDVHRASVFTPGVESHAAAMVPGAEQGLAGAAQAAAGQVSPLIQMIMRMPGQIGLFSSMFEALGNFFMGHADLLAGFDPSIMSGVHTAFTSIPGGEHMGFNLAMLPGDAPFLNLHNLGGLGGGGDFMSMAKAGMPQGFNTHDILKDSIALRDQLKISGGLDLNKPQFEMGRGLSSQVDGISKGDALSGPAMHDAGTANHLAGANRLFGDRPVSMASHSPFANSTNTVASAQNAVTSTSNSLNVSGSNFQAETGALGDAQNVSGSNLQQIGKAATDSSTASSIGPSGAIGDKLGGSNNYLAMDKGVTTFRPTLGQPAGGGYDANYLQQQTPTADAGHGLGGLKAKALSLDSVTNAAKSHATAAHTAAAAPSHSASAAGAAKPSAESIAHAKPSAEHVAHHAKSVMDHVGHQNVVHNHSAGFKGHDGISHVTKAPAAHAADHRVAAASQFKPATPATNASFEQVANGQSADGTQMDASQMAPADASQMTDGTQIAQAGDAAQAPAGSDAAVQSAPAAPETYSIRSGDNLWNIAKDHLGSGNRWSEIYKMNADVLGSNPSLIHPGTNIQLPGSGSEIAAAGAEHGTYIVKAGDNLWNISKGLTGDGSKWGEIYNLNKDVIGSNPSLITPGQELHLPGAAAEAPAGTLAQAPTAAASQQLASAPQAATAPVNASTGGDALKMEGGSPIGADGTVAQTPVESYPVEMQPQAAPQQAMEMPQTAAPQQAMAPAQTHLGGPGAAAAAELPPQPTPAELQSLVAKNDSIVSSNLGADLSQFIRKNK